MICRIELTPSKPFTSICGAKGATSKAGRKDKDLYSSKDVPSIRFSVVIIVPAAILATKASSLATLFKPALNF